MKDIITKLLLKVVNILFFYNVIGTSYGCLFGLLLLSLQKIFALYIPITGLIEWYGFIAFGIFIFNIPPMIKNKYTDPQIEIRLKYVMEILKQGNFTEKEKRVIWQNTLNDISREWSGNRDNTNHKDNNNAIA